MKNKIENIINKTFDLRLETAVFSYIISKGTWFCERISDDDIEALEGSDFMTKEFSQALVKCARQICKECEWIDIVNYIRFDLNFSPTPKEITLYREDFTEESFASLLSDLDLDDEEVGDEIELYAIKKGGD